MPNKIPIIGFTNSGKTTYLAGMFFKMTGGIIPLTLGSNDHNINRYLLDVWAEIMNGNPPLPTTQIETYPFMLTHNFNPVCKFDWLDYPGNILISGNTPEHIQLINDMQEAQCILFIVDGEKFVVPPAQDEGAYESAVLQNLNDPGINAQIVNLGSLPNQGIRLPPIGIIVTKCDLITQYQSSVINILRTKFMPIFNGGNNRVVLPISVSLGGPIDQNFNPNRTFNVEQPIAFAIICIFINLMKQARQEIQKNADIIQYELNRNRFLRNAKRIDNATANIRAQSAIIKDCADHCDNFINLFNQQKQVYIAGVPVNFHDHYSQQIRDLLNIQELIAGIH